MSDENTVLAEKYSSSEDHMYEIYQNSAGQFDLWLFGYSERMSGYYALDEKRMLLNSLEEAKKAGDALLQELG